MDEPPCHLDQIHRDGVLEAIQEVSAHRGWSRLAAICEAITCIRR